MSDILTLDVCMRRKENRQGEVEAPMRGLAVFTVFLVIFLASSLAVALPLFPGNAVCMLFAISDPGYVSLVNALVNGVFYGFVAWIIFSLSFRWIERAQSKNKAVKTKR